MSFLKKLRKYKKAGMELSINAIVILIIALIVLGIGVVFVRGMFGKISERVGTAVSETEVSKPATPDQPITLDPAQLSISQGAATGKTLIISGYNGGAAQLTAVTPTIANCAGDLAVANTKLVAAPQDIPTGKAAHWKAIFSLTGTEVVSGANAVCTVNIPGVSSAQLIVSVTD